MASNVQNVTSEMNNVSDSTIPLQMEFCITETCITTIVLLSIISILGIIGNLLVICIVLHDKKLHRVTFVSIAVLAFCDLSFVLPRYIRVVVARFFSGTFDDHSYRIFRYVLDFYSLCGSLTSILHVVLLSLMRYYFVVHPLRIRVWLTVRKVFIISGITWVLCSVIAGVYFYAVILNRDNDKYLARYTNLVVTVSMSILPVILIVIFHFLKARKLRKSLSRRNDVTIQRMSRVVSLVCVCFLVTTTPANVLDIMLLSDLYTDRMWFPYLFHATYILFFINYSINPYIYFLHTPRLTAFYTNLMNGKISSKQSMSSSRSKNSSHKGIEITGENIHMDSTIQHV